MAVARVAVLLGCLLAGPLLAAGPVVTRVIATQQPAEQWLPVLRPLAGPDVTVQAFRGQLLIRGPSDQVDALGAILGQLDRPLRNLRISVRQASGVSTSAAVGHVTARDGRVIVGARRDEARVDSRQLLEVTVLEGTPAWLSVDTEIPTLGTTPSGAVTGGYLPLGNGLELLPTLSGERVRLQLRQRTARNAGADIRTSTIDTVLLVAPGEWVPLGEVAGGDDAGGHVSGAVTAGGEGAVAGRRTGEHRHADVGWEVRIEVLEP